MNTHYYYLLINIAAISIPFLASFYPKANFSAQWKALFPAILITAVIFIAWDVWFTDLGVWGFNTDYLIGIKLFNLPIEELLFFLTIPYSCMFTYFALNHLIKKDYFKNIEKYISLFLLTVAGLGVFIYSDRYYTFYVLLLTVVLLILLKAIFKVDYLSRFYFTFMITLIPFIIINGILTGSFLEEPIVWYNNSENLNLRVGTVPIEDFFYSFTLLICNVALFEKFKQVLKLNE